MPSRFLPISFVYLLTVWIILPLGHPDLLAQANPSSASSYSQTPSVPGYFAPGVSYGSGGYLAEAVAVGDVNGDGKPDLIVANNCASSTNCNDGTPGEVSVLLGNGDGTFRPAVSYSAGALIDKTIESLRRD